MLSTSTTFTQDKQRLQLRYVDELIGWNRRNGVAEQGPARHQSPTMLSASAVMTHMVTHPHNTNRYCNCIRLVNALAGIIVMELLFKSLQDISLSPKCSQHQQQQRTKTNRNCSCARLVNAATGIIVMELLYNDLQDVSPTPEKRRLLTVESSSRSAGKNCL
jgi:hypothetical protein